MFKPNRPLRILLTVSNDFLGKMRSHQDAGELTLQGKVLALTTTNWYTQAQYIQYSADV
jgi:hypothetical protein